MTVVLAPVSGTSLAVSDIPDPVFSSGMVGSGLAIDPDLGPQSAVAPIRGRLAKLHPHAFLVVGDDEQGVLVHLGIDTVHLHGEGFTVVATENEQVEAGQDIVRWDPSYVTATGRSPICAVVVLDCDVPARLLRSTGAWVRAAEPIFDISC